MIRAAPWEVLGTSAAAGRSARGRSSGCVRTPKPPQRKLQRWRLAHHSTRDNEAILSPVEGGALASFVRPRPHAATTAKGPFISCLMR
jgi:hypothetical protein